jgi:hypothetical protein
VSNDNLPSRVPDAPHRKEARNDLQDDAQLRNWQAGLFFQFLKDLLWREWFGDPIRAFKTTISIILGTLAFVILFITFPGLVLLLVTWLALWWIWLSLGTTAELVEERNFAAALTGVWHILVSALVASAAIGFVWWHIGMPTSLTKGVGKCVMESPLVNNPIIQRCVPSRIGQSLACPDDASSSLRWTGQVLVRSGRTAYEYRCRTNSSRYLVFSSKQTAEMEVVAEKSIDDRIKEILANP